MNMNLRSVETIWRDELVRDVESAHWTKRSAIRLSGNGRRRIRDMEQRKREDREEEHLGHSG